MGIAKLSLIAAFAAAAVLWFVLAQPPGDTSEEAADPRYVPASSAVVSGVEGTNQRESVFRVEPAVDVTALVAQWLFDPDGSAAEASISAAVERRDTPLDAVRQMILDFALEDGARATPRLCRSGPISNFLRREPVPLSGVVSAALRYKRLAASGTHHVDLQGRLVGWPCHDEASCLDAITAEIASLPDALLWIMLRDRLLSRGSAGVSAIVNAALKLTADPQPSTARIALVMEALFAFSGSAGDVVVSLRDAMLKLGDASWAGQLDSGRNKVLAFGSWNSRMSVWSAAFRSCLSGSPSQPDGLSVSSRQSILTSMLADKWPDDRQQGNAFHRLMLSLVDGRKDPATIAYQRNVAKHASLPGVRITALSKLGMTQSIADLEQLFGEIVAGDVSAIGDESLRVGFFAAVDNARLVSSGNRDDAMRLFAECLAEPGVDAVEYQTFVLQALERNPMVELAWAVEQLRHHPGKTSVRQQAERNLVAMRR